MHEITFLSPYLAQRSQAQSGVVIQLMAVSAPNVAIPALKPIQVTFGYRAKGVEQSNPSKRVGNSLVNNGITTRPVFEIPLNYQTIML
jgi:hypothetical protein